MLEHAYNSCLFFLQVNVLTNLEVTISLSQICLLIELYNEYFRLIAALFVNDGRDGILSPADLEPPSCKGTSLRTTDSGIESLELNSAASSIISKSESNGKFCSKLVAVFSISIP